MGLVRGSHTRLLTLPGGPITHIIMATAEDLAKKSEMNDQLREYITQWRDERSKEEAELKRLRTSRPPGRRSAPSRRRSRPPRREQRRRRSRRRSRGKGRRCSPLRRREARSLLVPPWTLAKRCP